MDVQTLANRRRIIIRHHGPDDPRVAELDGEVRAGKIENFITKVMAGAPPLTPAQKRRLRSMIDRAGTITRTEAAA
jgi:hypothetical protein